MDPIALHHAMLLQHHALKLQQDSMIMLTMLKIRRKKHTKKKYWVVPWLRGRQRDHYGQYTSLMKELRLGDEASYRNYLRMPPEMFDELLTREDHSSTLIDHRRPRRDHFVDNLRLRAIFSDQATLLDRNSVFREEFLDFYNLTHRRWSNSNSGIHFLPCQFKVIDTVEFMEENSTTMSDYSLIDNQRELTKILSELEVQMTNCEHSVRFTREVNQQGKKGHSFSISFPTDMCVTDNGDVYFTDYNDNTIRRLSPSGSVSKVISTDPLVPSGICQSVDGGLLVTLRDNESGPYKLESKSRCLVRHITVKGDVILELVIMSPSGRMKSVYHGQNLTEDFRPVDVVSDSLCNILGTDPNNKQIHLLSPDWRVAKVSTDRK
ncbi:uncharacterized protein LOC134283798 [Saccostrea cucullata]|uniref:uncharacterized protein LOC134283798 n=1 Tax=Saccostrea cuccullata TaxID=36930 RepID=UPI002ED0E9B7